MTSKLTKILKNYFFGTNTKKYYSDLLNENSENFAKLTDEKNKYIIRGKWIPNFIDVVGLCYVGSNPQAGVAIIAVGEYIRSKYTSAFISQETKHKVEELTNYVKQIQKQASKGTFKLVRKHKNIA